MCTRNCVSKANVAGAKTGQPIDGTTCSACLIRHSTYYAAVMSGNGEHFELFAQINGSPTICFGRSVYAHNCCVLAVFHRLRLIIKIHYAWTKIFTSIYVAREKHVNSTCTWKSFCDYGFSVMWARVLSIIVAIIEMWTSCYVSIGGAHIHLAIQQQPRIPSMANG